MAMIDASFLTQRKWQVGIGIVVLIGLYYLFRPERDPVEIIRENLYSWAAQLEKSPEPASATAERSPQAVSASSSAALLESFGHVRRLIRSAFTEDAQIQAVRGPREQGREAITKWCFALRDSAEQVTLQLSEVDIRCTDATPDEAEASLLVHVEANRLGQRHSQSYRCELQLTRDPGDKKWRIALLTAQSAPTIPVPSDAALDASREPNSQTASTTDKPDTE